MIFFVRVRRAVVSLFSDWIEGIYEHLSLSTPHLCNIPILFLITFGLGKGGAGCTFIFARCLTFGVSRPAVGFDILQEWSLSSSST